MPSPESQLENMAELGFESMSLYDSKFYKGVGDGRKCQGIKHRPVLAVGWIDSFFQEVCS